MKRQEEFLDKLKLELQIMKNDKNDKTDKKSRKNINMLINKSGLPLKILKSIFEQQKIDIPYAKRILNLKQRDISSLYEEISKPQTKDQQKTIAEQLSLIYHVDGQLLDQMYISGNCKYIVRYLMRNDVQTQSLALILTNKIYDNKIPKEKLIVHVKSLYKYQISIQYQNQVRYIIQFLLDTQQEDPIIQYYVNMIEQPNDEQMISVMLQIKNENILIPFIKRLNMHQIQDKHICLYRLCIKNNVDNKVISLIRSLQSNDFTDMDIRNLVMFAISNGYEVKNLHYMLYMFFQDLSKHLSSIQKIPHVPINDLDVPQFNLVLLPQNIIDNILVRKNIFKIQETLQSIMFANRPLQNKDLFFLTEYIIDHSFPSEIHICDSLLYHQNIEILKKTLLSVKKMYRLLYNQDMILKDSILSNMDQDTPRQDQIINLLLEYGLQSSFSTLFYGVTQKLNRQAIVTLVSSLKYDTQQILYQLNEHNIKIQKNDQISQQQCMICLDETTCTTLKCKYGCKNTVCEGCQVQLNKCLICKKNSLNYFIFH